MLLQPVILSGGSGTRLWPLSREAHPKQFLALCGDQTMLQMTANRVDGLDEACELLAPIVVCNEAHRFLVAEQLAGIGKTPAAILLEPVGRNTAPALTLAALAATADGRDPALLAMPADHRIGDEPGFRELVAAGCRLAGAGNIVTFGIVPTHPETGFGYIRAGEPIDGQGARRLAAFVEKPDAATAAEYLASGDYLWNSGIFLVTASRWLELMREYAPDILKSTRDAMAGAERDGLFLRPRAEAFEATRADSIDYAVMEPLSALPAAESSAVVLPMDADWSDLGAWPALCEVNPADENGNVLHGDVFTLNASDNLVHAEERLVAVVGVDDLIIVETPDAVLITHKDRAQEVKAVANYLKKSGRIEHEFHRCVHRPWGSFEGIGFGNRYQVKRLTVNPGAKLSLQMHHHRAEHWIVVTGTARVTRDGEEFLLTENQSTYIPLGASHRLENPGCVPLEIIEVQSGSYLGEDDIIRFDDDYNRKSDA